MRDWIVGVVSDAVISFLEYWKSRKQAKQAPPPPPTQDNSK